MKSGDKTIQIKCIGEALELANAVILHLSQALPKHTALAQKEIRRKEGKKIRDDRLKAKGREKVREALLELKKEKQPYTILNARWKINQMFGDAGQRSIGNLMLPNPEYHMSLATITRRLKEMPGVIEEIWGIVK